MIDNDPPPSSKALPKPPRQPSYIDEIEEDLEKVVNDLGIKDDQTTDQDLVEEAASSNPPKILKKIAKLSEVLRSKKASDSVIYNLLNILYPLKPLIMIIIIVPSYIAHMSVTQ